MSNSSYQPGYILAVQTNSFHILFNTNRPYVFSLSNSRSIQSHPPSVLWCCWLGSRKGIRPAKTKWWDDGVVICLERGAHLHMAQLMLLPLTVSCFSKIHIGFTFQVLAHPGGGPGKRAVKRECVCVCVCVCQLDLISWLSGCSSLPHI